MKYERDDFDKAMLENGLTNQQLLTAAYDAVKKIVTNHPEIPLNATLPEKISEAGRVCELLSQYIATGKLSMISDRDTIDALLCFQYAIKAVKEVFGEENMTTEVMCKAIEAGSYLGYRSIMGEASKPTKRY
jgi:hypothetical protein